jgi:hypothetical protein
MSVPLHTCAPFSLMMCRFSISSHYQVSAENPRPNSWSKRCSGIASTQRFHRVVSPMRSFERFSIIVSFVALAGMYFSLQHLSLSDATVLTFIAPILTGFSGAIFLKEPFSLREMFAGCKPSLSSYRGCY